MVVDVGATDECMPAAIHHGHEVVTWLVVGLLLSVICSVPIRINLSRHKCGDLVNLFHRTHYELERAFLGDGKTVARILGDVVTQEIPESFNCQSYLGGPP